MHTIAPLPSRVYTSWIGYVI